MIRAFQVLDLFRSHRHLGASQCASLLGMTRASAHRMLVSLTEAGAIERIDSGRYRLSIWMFEVGSQVPLLRGLTDLAQLPMERLNILTKRNVHLAVREGFELIYLLKVGQATGRARTRPGTRNPLHATGLGKILLAWAPEPFVDDLIGHGLRTYTKYTITSPARLLAELAEVRATGFSYDREERQVGVSCVATSIRDSSGRVIASISIPFNSEDYAAQHPERARQSLRETAQAIEARVR
ncbi:IclR family transcriptional regulator [Glaciibacter superstes]|uniref:IclR family transcriptional regulator n=1 Tax=Glaciibacter superstes TaxID=501023 RepID=UPI00248138A2|nr:IclR family transcriptional regulator [Glaciibacter superstes]